IGKNMNVMSLTLSHRDQEIAQRLLEEIIAQYMRRHLAIHHSLATYEQVQDQTEQVRLRLERTMDQLKEAKRNANISNLEQARADLRVQSAKLQGEVLTTEADLIQAQAQLGERRAYATNMAASVAASSATNEV